jgi:hypothetical protein
LDPSQDLGLDVLGDAPVRGPPPAAADQPGRPLALIAAQQPAYLPIRKRQHRHGMPLTDHPSRTRSSTRSRSISRSLISICFFKPSSAFDTNTKSGHF